MHIHDFNRKAGRFDPAADLDIFIYLHVVRAQTMNAHFHVFFLWSTNRKFRLGLDRMDPRKVCQVYCIAEAVSKLDKVTRAKLTDG